ncbi:LysR substrate-binding domain-containing protein [Pseudomonas benzenivorans]|uniref:LysR family transcriptional regulator n=1 Tax=Pseudomonas benzenivorans TaxID=556533 RepID=A0ABY5HA17_9PSED|nr:LysR substrate-binding domain-containing protein [Pseudomonas benzenivorans]UTW08222.1 LysR family transcriptional regulator [Pseudomonas benzenivorans]
MPSTRAIKLPMLTALPAFEASANLGSFTKAAESLNLTQSAVSFQVRKLEADLGVALFIRSQRLLTLTPEGVRFLKAVQSSLDILRAECEALAEKERRPQLVLSASFSLSSRWLIPRLPSLQAQLTEVDLRLDANDRAVDLEHEGIDIAIRYCICPPKDIKHQPLFQDHIFPVCSPQLDLNLTLQPSLNCLAGITLLHDNMTDFGWRNWLASVGVDLPNADRGPRFSHTAGAIEAAIRGQGMALGRLALVAEDLISGRLIRPFGQVAVSEYAYYVLWPEKTRQPELTRVVRDWLKREAEITHSAIFG